MSGYRFDRLKVLIVDDNAHMRKLVAAILQAFGAMDITEAPDAEKAWVALKETNADVIILDWMMEGMNGLDLAKQIRTSPDSPNPFVPIIMLTGHTNIDNVRLARDAGINEFLAKPVSVRAILTRLISVIDHPRPFVRTKIYFGPCRRRRGAAEYRGAERRATGGDISVDPDNSLAAE